MHRPDKKPATLGVPALLAIAAALVPLGLMASVPVPPATIAGGSAAPGQAHMAGVLANDARKILRDPSLPPETAARQAATLLQMAARLDESNVRTLKTYAEAARAAGQSDLQKEALRKLISADGGDLVAQVQYIDLLAGATQELEERAKIYQAAYGQKTLNAQIRSEMAARLARVAEQRGDLALAKQYLEQAVQLNDVNVGALRDLVRLSGASGPQRPAATDIIALRLKALIALLSACPYQSDAWLEVAQICQAANLHDRAVDLLIAAAEQFQIDGAPPSGELYLELAMERAISGERGPAYQMANELAQLPDAPLAALLIAQVTAGEAAAPASTEKLEKAIHSRLADIVKTSGTDGLRQAAALADAAGIDLSLMPTVSLETAGYIDAYAKLVAADDGTLLRLRGWQLYRQNKLDDAKAALEKAPQGDPMVQLGLARIAIDQGKKDIAARTLQDLWSSQPTGLLALQVSQTARNAKLALADTAWTRQVRDMTAKLTPVVATMHRQPREADLLTVGLRRPAIGYGEVETLTIRMANTTDRPLPVGADGVIKTTVGVAASIRDREVLAPTPLGLCAAEDLQRIYRLDPRQTLEATIRVDQGTLGDMLEENPARSYVISAEAVTAPRVLGAVEFSTGVGGQMIPAGDFERGGFSLHSPADLERFLRDLAATTGEKQLARIQAAGAILRAMVDKKPVEGAAPAVMADAQEPLISALRLLAASPDPLVRAMVVRVLPAATLGAEIDKALDPLAADADPLVRIYWAKRLGRMARQPGEPGRAALAALEQRAAAEKDNLVKDWISLELAHAKDAAHAPESPAGK